MEAMTLWFVRRSVSGSESSLKDFGEVENSLRPDEPRRRDVDLDRYIVLFWLKYAQCLSDSGRKESRDAVIAAAKAMMIETSTLLVIWGSLCEETFGPLG